MATNRLRKHFSSDHAAGAAEQPPVLKGFEAVPVKSIPGWTELSTEDRALYEFAYLLAQAQCKDDVPSPDLPRNDGMGDMR